MARAEILALIPARGGSKSVPRKNLRKLAGKPLIAHSIEQAAASARITRVVVSTDDEEIAAVARSLGAEAPFLRPAEFARDDSPDLPVARHALDWLREREGYEPQAVAWLRPTAPLRRLETIDRAIDDFLARPEMDSLRTVSLAQQTPFKMWFIAADGALEPVTRLPGRESYNMPRQALPRVYWQNGYLDVTRPATVRRGSMTGERILSFVIEELCIEIDYEDQFAAVESFLRTGKSGTGETPQADRFPS
jgi:CMP-N,N'-diacetyllegionaminic acid synthase